jgi:AcrR family transcriptional regulator
MLGGEGVTDVIADEDLGGRLPRGPHRLSAEDVATDQRRRLFDALVWLIGIKGYVATSVTDVIARAGISRRTFYELFPNSEELLNATFETCARSSLERGRASCERSGGPTRQLEALMRGMCREARERPGASALVAVEILATRPAGFELREKLMSEYAQLIQDCLSPDGERPMPEVLARTLAGAAHREISARVSVAKTDELASLGPELARWTRSYHPLPARFELDGERTRPWPSLGMDGRLGGRAPGTLTLASNGNARVVDRRARGLLAHVNRERLLDAVAQLNSHHGYAALTIEMIAEHADLPERVFRASFESKEEAFATALELGHTKGQAIVERTRASYERWQDGVRKAIRALLEFLASEPDFTRLALLDAPLAGPATARRSNEHVATYARLLFEGAPQRRNPPQAAPEAIVHALFELAFRHVLRDTTATLPHSAPHAVYLALAPFVGVSEAGRATGET